MKEGFDPNRYENPCKYYAENSKTDNKLFDRYSKS
jgi:hypothetical protein